MIIKYVAAIATAVTLAIAAPVSTDVEVAKKVVDGWGKPTAEFVAQFKKPILLSAAGGPYILSTLEQAALRKALLKGLRIVDLGRSV